MNILVNSGSVFWFCALAGSGLFFIQLMINLFGMGDADSGSDDIRHFKWLSIQAVTGFLMIFGWTAITCQNEFDQALLPTVAISLVAGLIAALIIHFLIQFTKRLQSSGSIYRIEEAIGKEAYVYQCIPKGGLGKITVSLQHLTHEIDAISDQDADLKSFSRVKIIKKADDNTVVVTPI